MPDRETIGNYQRADLILLNGANYAKWVGAASLPLPRMVDTSRLFKDRYIYVTEATTHSHGPEGAHADESLAFTTWLNLDLAIQHAEAIGEALIRVRPLLKDTFEKNLMALKIDLRALDNDLKEVAATKTGAPLIGSHPVYDYLAEAYDLNLKSVHWEPGEEPSVQQWQALKTMLNDHPAKWMIWEGQPMPAVVEKLKELGVSSLVYDPCGNVPETGDFLSVMQSNVRNLRARL